jgi:hypothetical protein
MEIESWGPKEPLPMLSCRNCTRSRVIEKEKKSGTSDEAGPDAPRSACTEWVTHAGLESRALRGLWQLLMLGQGHVPGKCQHQQ